MNIGDMITKREFNSIIEESISKILNEGTGSFNASEAHEYIDTIKEAVVNEMYNVNEQPDAHYGKMESDTLEKLHSSLMLAGSYIDKYIKIQRMKWRG